MLHHFWVNIDVIFYTVLGSFLLALLSIVSRSWLLNQHVMSLADILIALGAYQVAVLTSPTVFNVFIANPPLQQLVADFGWAIFGMTIFLFFLALRPGESRFAIWFDTRWTPNKKPFEIDYWIGLLFGWLVPAVWLALNFAASFT